MTMVPYEEKKIVPVKQVLPVVVPKKSKAERKAEKEAKKRTERAKRTAEFEAKAKKIREDTEARRLERKRREELIEAKIASVKERIKPSPAITKAFEVSEKGAEIAMTGLGRGTRRAARASGSGLAKTGRFLRSWSSKMPDIQAPAPTGILPAGRYVLTGRQGYDVVYNELENVFGSQGFTVPQAIELLQSIGFDKNAVRTRVQAFIANGSIVPEPIVPPVGAINIIPKAVTPPTKSLTEEIFS